MKTRRKHSFEVRMRAFKMWRNLGFMPWKKPRENRSAKSGEFYKGAFDNIPFLNDDAKRTFQHLLLRPGHMIRDYIGGQHERYLAPLTALIVFYAFFALVSAVLQPVQQKDNPLKGLNQLVESEQDSVSTSHFFGNIARITRQGYLYLHLDQHPEEVDTRHEAAIAALENTLRSQGIPLFIGEFLLLWLAMVPTLRRRYKISRSACAAASAYVLCQFSFFMLFAVLLTLGESASISVTLMFLLLMLDYHEWLGISWKRSFWLAVRTGIWVAVVYVAFALLLSFVVFVAATFMK